MPNMVGFFWVRWFPPTCQKYTGRWIQWCRGRPCKADLKLNVSHTSHFSSLYWHKNAMHIWFTLYFWVNSELKSVSYCSQTTLDFCDEFRWSQAISFGSFAILTCTNKHTKEEITPEFKPTKHCTYYDAAELWIWTKRANEWIGEFKINISSGRTKPHECFNTV